MGEQRVLGWGVDMQPGGDLPDCVLDIGRGDLCLHAKGIRCRAKCQWWREPETATSGSGRTNDRQSAFEHHTTRTTGNDLVSGANPGGTHPGQ